MTKRIVILGSTGSIGRQTLDVCDLHGITVCALTAGTNAVLLAEQCRKYRPSVAVMATEDGAIALRELISDLPTEVLCGEEGLLAAATLSEADTVVTALVGIAGLKPTLAAIRAGKRIALANKETLVCAGELVMAQAAQYGAEIIPVDSEHSAIFQCLMGCADRGEIKKLILTCSGGPFYGMTREQLKSVTKRDALRHPNWKMGDKITIDCATLMNKGLEFIEAMRLYAVSPEQIEVAIHRQSIVHSLVEFRDGAVMAQLGTPDMRLPIQLALTYPQRKPSPAPELNLFTCGDLTFAKPDLDAFPSLKLAMDAAKAGGTACPILNGANEAAVALYLQDRIGFYDISDAVASALQSVQIVPANDLETVLEADRAARASVRNNFG